MARPSTHALYRFFPYLDRLQLETTSCDRGRVRLDEKLGSGGCMSGRSRPAVHSLLQHRGGQQAGAMHPIASQSVRRSMGPPARSRHLHAVPPSLPPSFLPSWERDSRFFFPPNSLYASPTHVLLHAPPATFVRELGQRKGSSQADGGGGGGA